MNPEEPSDQRGTGAQPPRLLFGAPPRRTPSHAAQPSDTGGVPTARAPLAAPVAGALPISDPAHLQPPVIPQGIPMPSRLRRMLFAPVKFFWGMLFCQSVLGALAVLGWTYRLMQRSVLKLWWKLSESSARTRGFAEFLADDPRTREHAHWPNWFLVQNFREAVRRNSAASLRRHLLAVLNAVGQSLWTNVRLGVQGIFNTWVLTLPACVLMLFGWYDGWNNSFNKGYEQFSVGPGVSVLGILLFIAAMLYVPMAQARQAVTGKWRAFYQFRLVWTLVRRRWLACFGLAMLYALGSVPMMVLMSVVMFLPNINPGLADSTPSETIQVLNRYFFWSALFVFPAFVVLRLIAARIYGSTLLRAVQSGAVAQDALAESEWHVLQRLDLLQVQAPRPRHPVWRIVAWAGTRAGRVTFGFLTGLVWFVFVAELYIAQFFNYRGATVWLNQTLVQLPWFHYLPVALKNPWGDFFVAAAIVFVAWRLKRMVIWLKSLHRH